MERNNEQVKNVWKPLCIVFAALLAFSWLFFGFLYSKGGVNFSTLEAPEQEQTENGGAVIGKADENGVKLMSAQIPASEYADNNISPLAETAYTLTATVEPADATDKTVDWSVAFVNPSSEWANGKTVTDYVTVTPASDGALTANVACLKQFGEQIKITVTARSNPAAYASCIADYRQKVESWSAMVMGADFNSFQLQKSSETVYLSGYLLLGSGAATMFTNCKLSTAYTLAGREYNYRAIEMSLTDEAKTALQSAGVTLSSTESTLIWESDWDAVGSDVSADGIHDNFTEIFFLQPDMSKLSAAFDSAAYDVNFRIIFGNDSGSEPEIYEEYNYQVNLNLDFFNRAAENVELDRDEIVF